MWNLSLLALTGSRARRPLLPSPFNVMDARFSPDGRFVAFQADDSGRIEAVRGPVSDGRQGAGLDGGRRVITMEPRWP